MNKLVLVGGGALLAVGVLVGCSDKRQSAVSDPQTKSAPSVTRGPALSSAQENEILTMYEEMVPAFGREGATCDEMATATEESVARHKPVLLSMGASRRGMTPEEMQRDDARREAEFGARMQPIRQSIEGAVRKCEHEKNPRLMAALRTLAELSAAPP